MAQKYWHLGREEVVVSEEDRMRKEIQSSRLESMLPSCLPVLRATAGGSAARRRQVRWFFRKGEGGRRGEKKPWARKVNPGTTGWGGSWNLRIFKSVEAPPNNADSRTTGISKVLHAHMSRNSTYAGKAIDTFTGQCQDLVVQTNLTVVN